MRALLVVVLCASVGCGGFVREHPRTTIVGGATVLGAFAFGLPAAQECTPEEHGDCGLAHDAAYVGVGAVIGAVIGGWIAYEWWLQDAGRRAAEAERATAKKK